MQIQKARNAFTLAEVLITLGIIGVVAALTIPTLIQNTNDKATITALKKTYSVLTQAYKMAIIDNGTMDTWDVPSGDHKPIIEKIAPYLKVAKNCTDGSLGCSDTSIVYKFLADSSGDIGTFDDIDWIPKLKLADGTFLFGIIDSSSCSASSGNTEALQQRCGWYGVDINGEKKPNQIGKDLFYFWVTKEAIVPAGSEPDTSYAFDSVDGCKDKSADNGYGCAAWVIYNENLDYLKCSDLAWNGKHKCG